MARVINESRSITCHPRVYPRVEWTISAFALIPSQSWSSFTDPGRIEGWVGLGTTTVNEQSVQDCYRRYVTAIAVVSSSNCHASLGNWSSEIKRRTYDLLGHIPHYTYHWDTESPEGDDCPGRMYRQSVSHVVSRYDDDDAGALQ